MATQTTNINLTIPATDESANIADINGNMEKIDTAFGKECIMLTLSGVSALPYSVTAGSAAKITAQHKVIMSILSNPAAMSGAEWEYETVNGGIEITGTISGSTDIIMFLARTF